MSEPRFRTKSIGDLRIRGERDLHGIPIYARLKQALIRDGYSFRVLPPPYASRWDRALLLNLTFWEPGSGGDILLDGPLDADVVAHAAWHHLASKALPKQRRLMSAEAMFFGEAIASAFDVYLVGALLRDRPDADFLRTQVPLMAEAAATAGMNARRFESLLERIAGDPAASFESLRVLLLEATVTLYVSRTADIGLGALHRLNRHPFAALLPHYEVSNWVLHGRAYGSPARDARVRALDGTLRRARGGSLDWLVREWLGTALVANTSRSS